MRKWIMMAFMGSMTAGAFVSATLAQNVKIGFVNTLEVLYATEEGKRELEQLNQFGAQKQQEITTLSSELQKARDEYVTQQATLSVTASASRERDIADKERSLQRLQEDVELEYNQKRDELLGRVSEKIQVIINEYAQENFFGVIFLRNETQTYVDLSLDVTQEIIKIYDERNPVTGQSASQ